MGKTRDCFKKMRDTKRTFQAKTSTIKDRNGTDLTEAEDIEKQVARIHRRTVQEDLNDPDNHDGVVIHLEPNNLECEVQWAFRSITTNKASGGDMEFQLTYFKSKR